jgi:hypothetical protein
LCVGLKDIKNFKAADYNAVLLVNSCMSWRFDRRIRQFLRSNSDAQNIIIYTTAADSTWMPKSKKYSFGAVCSASSKESIGWVSAEIIEKINAHMPKG